MKVCGIREELAFNQLPCYLSFVENRHDLLHMVDVLVCKLRNYDDTIEIHKWKLPFYGG